MSITGVLPEEYGIGQESRPTIEIRKLQGIYEAEICARMMPRSLKGSEVLLRKSR